ncbi:hypothetical protein OROGR_027444 [Orobanche gracilis]
MSHHVVRVKREAVAPCMTCPLCHKLFRDATTIIECLHTFCRKCIYKMLSDEEMECCPICNIDLGCVPLEKLRPDHNLQDVRAKIFPHKRTKWLNSASFQPSDEPSRDKARENHTELWEGKINLWNPLTCLVEAANRSKSSKFGAQGPHVKSEEQRPCDNDGPVRKKQNKEQSKRLKVKDEKKCTDHTTPMDYERHKNSRKIRQKARDFGEFRVPPQVVLDAASAKFERTSYPIWFSLVASEDLEGDASPLPQISASYLRVKDGSIPVSFIQKYLQRKLDLTSELEVDVKCMGQKVNPTLTLNNLVDLWLRTTSGERVSAAIGSSAKDFVMVLGYSRRVPNT